MTLRVSIVTDFKECQNANEKKYIKIHKNEEAIKIFFSANFYDSAKKRILKEKNLLCLDFIAFLLSDFKFLK